MGTPPTSTVALTRTFPVMQMADPIRAMVVGHPTLTPADQARPKRRITELGDQILPARVTQVDRNAGPAKSHRPILILAIFPPNTLIHRRPTTGRPVEALATNREAKIIQERGIRIREHRGNHVADIPTTAVSILETVVQEIPTATAAELTVASTLETVVQEIPTTATELTAVSIPETVVQEIPTTATELTAVSIRETVVQEEERLPRDIQTLMKAAIITLLEVNRGPPEVMIDLPPRSIKRT